ncbi:MAG: hypothetical protein OHK0039_47980 [Bacteroidia bacterium]
MPILECIPNFSEGRDQATLDSIAAAIRAVPGVHLLDIDPGATTHRTVMTFAGDPAAVVEAAFQAIARAAEHIDMRRHKGTHPRMGATDVCPLVPIEGIDDEEAIAYAHALARRVGEELDIPVYLYEKAATRPERKNLATIRAGEYEGFAEKILLPEWKPDYGPQRFNARAGQTVIGVRDFLVAYNINLNTRSVRRANSVAFDIREKGRVQTEDGTPWGRKVLDAEGRPVREPGRCKAVKAIGWYVPEYGRAQVSANLTDLRQSPVHEVFEAACESARSRGLRVTGSELVGLIPKQSLLDAAYYYLRRQGVSQGMSEAELIQVAVQSLGLDDLRPFDPQQKVIEYQLEAAMSRPLAQMPLRDFADLLASDAPAPGGGSVAALLGSLGAALGTMVANLSGNKRGWDARTAEFDPWARQGQALKDALMRLVDDDTAAFQAVMEAYRLPKGSEGEKELRKNAIEAANLRAAEVPLQVMRVSAQCYPLLREMAAQGNPNSLSDVGVGALCVHAAVCGAHLNVQINLRGIGDPQRRAALAGEAGQIEQASNQEHTAILAAVRNRMQA